MKHDTVEDIRSMLSNLQDQVIDKGEADFPMESALKAIHNISKGKGRLDSAAVLGSLVVLSTAFDVDFDAVTVEHVLVSQKAPKLKAWSDESIQVIASLPERGSRMIPALIATITLSYLSLFSDRAEALNQAGEYIRRI